MQSSPPRRWWVDWGFQHQTHHSLSRLLQFHRWPQLLSRPRLLQKFEGKHWQRHYPQYLRIQRNSCRRTRVYEESEMTISLSVVCPALFKELQRRGRGGGLAARCAQSIWKETSRISWQRMSSNEITVWRVLSSLEEQVSQHSFLSGWPTGSQPERKPRNNNKWNNVCCGCAIPSVMCLGWPIAEYEHHWLFYLFVIRAYTPVFVCIVARSCTVCRYCGSEAGAEKKIILCINLRIEMVDWLN